MKLTPASLVSLPCRVGRRAGLTLKLCAMMAALTSMRPKPILLALALGSLVNAGCSTANLNPPAARANTGYVDFYTDANQELSWEIKRAREPGGKWKTVFSEFRPVKGSILRLAAPPGTYRFQVWFINLVTEGPQTVLVEVANGQITPVRVTLTPKGSALVQNKDLKLSPGPGRLRRGNRFSYESNQMFCIGLSAEFPQSYQPKEQRAYYQAPEP